MTEIICKEHKQKLKFISMLKDKAKFICWDCWYPLKQQYGLNFQNLIPIDEAINDPIYLLEKTKLSQQFLEFLHDDVKVNQFNKKFVEIFDCYESIIQSLRQMQSKLINYKYEILSHRRTCCFDQLKEPLKLKKFSDLLKQLKNNNVATNSDCVAQIEEQIFVKFQNIENDKEGTLRRQLELNFAIKCYQTGKEIRSGFAKTHEELQKLKMKFQLHEISFFKEAFEQYQNMPQRDISVVDQVIKEVQNNLVSIKIDDLYNIFKQL